MKRLISILLLTALVLTPTVSTYAEDTVAIETTAYEELKKGSKGDDVVALQERLIELGYLSSKASGKFDSETKKAVSAFQIRHGQEEDGVASIELQELLFSDSAMKAPYEMKVYPAKVKLTSKSLFYNIVNKSDENIDTVRSIYILLGSDGEIVSDQILSYEKNYLTKDWGYSTVIKAGKTHKDCLNSATDCFGWAISVAKKGILAVISYHTTNGETVTYSPRQLTYYYSDGSIEYPTEDIEPYIYTDEEAADLSKVKMGATTKNLYPWTAEFYGVAEGLYLLEVQPGALADKAGMKTGDIITLIDGKPAIEVKNQHDGRRKLLDGEGVEYTYSRNGAETTVVISMDMEAATQTTDDATSDETIGAELLRYGELLEKGLITQEEYDVLKKKLIFGE